MLRLNNKRDQGFYEIMEAQAQAAAEAADEFYKLSLDFSQMPGVAVRRFLQGLQLHLDRGGLRRRGLRQLAVMADPA